MTNKNVNKILGFIKKTPVINVAYKISNAYALEGSPLHVKETAKLDQWKKRIGKNLLFSIFIGTILALLFHYVGGKEVKSNFDPEDAILSIFPDILGFGIGVFALLFALPNNFLLKKSEENSKVSPTNLYMLPADLAYPLLIYCLIMLFAVFFRVFPESFFTTCLSTIFLIYGFIVTLELISTLFFTASLLVSKKIEESKETVKKDK